MAENKSKKSVAFPLIPAFFSFLYLIRTIREEFFGLLLIPGISGILCSAIAICLIKKYELNIFRYWKIFLLTVVIGAIVSIGGMLINSALWFWVVMSAAAIIVEYLILKTKIKSFKEKFILLTINPVLHFCIFMLVIDIYVSDELLVCY